MGQPAKEAPHPESFFPHLKLDSNSLKSYHVLHIKALASSNRLTTKDLSSLGGRGYEQDHWN
jgi:hypothetical protein